MDDFILPEDIDEENVKNMELDVSEIGAMLSTENKELEPTSVISAGLCAEAMSETLRNYDEVRKRITEVEQLAAQVRTLG